VHIISYLVLLASPVCAGPIGLQLSHDFKELPANAQASRSAGLMDQQWKSCDESNNYKPHARKLSRDSFQTGSFFVWWSHAVDQELDCSCN
jgi:hypothetical protein